MLFLYFLRVSISNELFCEFVAFGALGELRLISSQISGNVVFCCLFSVGFLLERGISTLCVIWVVLSGLVFPCPAACASRSFIDSSYALGSAAPVYGCEEGFAVGVVTSVRGRGVTPSFKVANGVIAVFMSCVVCDKGVCDRMLMSRGR